MTLKLLALFVLLATGGLEAMAEGCVAQGNHALEVRGITDYQTPAVAPIRRTKKNKIVGYNLWYRLDRCEKGFVVVRMSATCLLANIYSRGGCEVPGIDYWPH